MYIEALTQRTIEETTKEFELLRLSSAITAISSLVDTLKEYLDFNIVRIETIRDSPKSVVLMLTPLIPHVCEEMWRITGEDGYVSVARWPEIHRNKHG